MEWITKGDILSKNIFQYKPTLVCEPTPWLELENQDQFLVELILK